MTIQPSRTRTTRLLPAVLIAAALVLAACGGDDSTDGMSGMDGDASSSTSTPAEGEPGAEFNDADVMFAQMMLPHHRQAVEMSDVILAKEGIDERVIAIAEDIKAAQQPEIDQLTGFLESWGQDVPAAMEGMDMGEMDQGSGMMSQEQMQQLETAEGADAARLFLEGMSAHHAGAIEMAQAELDGGQDPAAQELAQSIIDSQQAEITQMQEILPTL